MKKLLSIVVALLLITTNTQAQDPKAKQVLDAVSAKIKTLKSMKANFSLNISKTKEKKSGTVCMKGTKYFVTLNGQEIYCDSKTISTYAKASNELTINGIDPNESTLSPTKLFSNFYDKEFKSKFLGEKTVGGKVVNMIELIPTKAKQFVKVVLQIDKLQNMISGGSVFEKNGNIMSYAVSGFTANPAFADNIFVFDAKKHPKVEVVDLR